MRLVAAIALGSLLVPALGTADIERALALARARESERQQFHRRYVVELKDPVVMRLEVITEFRRLELIAEEHVLRGDWMFTRGTRAASEALAATRGIITLTAQIRFNPLNTFVTAPDYKLAISARAGGPPEPVETELTPQYSVPFKTRDGKTLSSIIGGALSANVPADRIAQETRAVGVTLDGQEVIRTSIDFARLD
jgi:hypothetical protein